MEHTKRAVRAYPCGSTLFFCQAFTEKGVYMDNAPRTLIAWQTRWRIARKRPRRGYLYFASLSILLTLLAIAPRQASLQTYQFVKQSSSALAITDDGSRLLVVNPDSNKNNTFAKANQ